MQKEESSLKYKGDSFFQSKRPKEPKDLLEGFWNTIIPQCPCGKYYKEFPFVGIGGLSI